MNIEQLLANVRTGENTPMLGTAIAALLSIFFVLALGYATGRAKQFDADQTAGLSELVFCYALLARSLVRQGRAVAAELGVASS